MVLANNCPNPLQEEGVNAHKAYSGSALQTALQKTATLEPERLDKIACHRLFNLKSYHHHSLYPGGLTTVQFKDLIQSNPERIIMEGVKGMLPKSKLGHKMLTHCRVFAGSEHNLQAQKPVKLEL